GDRHQRHPELFHRIENHRPVGDHARVDDHDVVTVLDEADGGRDTVGAGVTLVEDMGYRGHLPLHLGSRFSVKARWNSAWSSVVISSAWVMASISRAADRLMSCSAVSSFFVAP